MNNSTFHSPWLDWKKPETPNLPSAKSAKRGGKGAFVTFGTSLPRGFSQKEDSHGQMERWDVKRIEIASQTKPGYVDIWMLATDLSDEANWRLWFAGTEPIQNDEEGVD